MARTEAMHSSLPSRTWSCQTLQQGLVLQRTRSMALGSCGEQSLEEMEAELQRLQVGVCYIDVFKPQLRQRAVCKTFPRLSRAVRAMGEAWPLPRAFCWYS